MENVIKRIYKRTTEYSHPSQATTTANALDLLSSGIYTEEERFIFELLQNAVDSFDNQKQSELLIKIVITDNQLVFMHNGMPFSERDLEGLCDIGNGNKMNDAKKIGYKGIGFKSVFMHSHCVTVLTADTCFRFDKEYCESIAESNKDYQGARLPWQIIPILSDKPTHTSTEGYNVATYINTSNRDSLKRKVEKLLNDTRFLLFLKVNDLRISLFDGSNEILNLSKQLADDVLTLYKNGKPQNNWLIHSEEVTLTPKIKEILVHDSKTPTKLKESQAVEISFAIALGEEHDIIPLNNALMYTYLPTSFLFGLPFIVNANFITDAGRQQIIKDCEWNKFIFSQIPSLFFTWLKDEIVHNHDDWYKVLPSKACNEDEISSEYNESLENALRTIPFVISMNDKCHLVNSVVADYIGLCSALPNEIINRFIKNEINSLANSSSIIAPHIGEALSKYNISSILRPDISRLMKKSENYLLGMTDEDMMVFLRWLKGFSTNENSDFIRELSYSPFLLEENDELICPTDIFFPSDYRDNTEVASSAKIIKPSLYKLMNTEMESWLKELGVKEMSNLSVIENVLCKEDFITKENAIDVMRFIFKVNKKENIFENISSYKLSKLKLITTKGSLIKASNLYLSDIYKPLLKIEENFDGDIFVSTAYPLSNSDVDDWAYFLKKLGVADEIILKETMYDEGDWPMSDSTIRGCIVYAKNNEYNPWGTRKYYFGCGGYVGMSSRSTPFLIPSVIKSSSKGVTFAQQLWNAIFQCPISGSKEDYFRGSTGYGWSKIVYLTSPNYLGKTFIEWVANSQQIIPASDGKLHNISEVLPNSSYNISTFGSYYPVIALETEIAEPWKSCLPFKKQLNLSEYLDILDKISCEDDKEAITENKKRINAIYELISDNFDLSENSQNYAVLHKWGSCHNLLSKENKFVAPSNLYLLSSRLSGIDIDNQVYHQKSVENERFEALMKAMGVNMVTSHKVTGIEDENRTSAQLEIQKLESKIDFLTTITSSDSFNQSTWDDAYQKMRNNLEKIKLFKVEAIRVSYGNTTFDKTVYIDGNELYFVGRFGMPNQEMLADSLLKLLDLHKNVKSIFLTILQMEDKEELKDYLQQKGYDTSFIKIESEIAPVESTTTPTMGGSESQHGGLSTEEQREALEEAKESILCKLMKDGFDTSYAEWNGWTCVDGVTKNGIEYPLVIRSNKSQKDTIISPTDWVQLMKPNAMYAVVTHAGVGTIAFRDILRAKENITIKFSSSNIDLENHISDLTKVFKYFKGIQFDLGSYIPATINSWQRFMAPEQDTGELPQSASTLSLPE